MNVEGGVVVGELVRELLELECTLEFDERVVTRGGGVGIGVGVGVD